MQVWFCISEKKLIDIEKILMDLTKGGATCKFRLAAINKQSNFYLCTIKLY